ncbi:MAG: signal recognition particle-docking protein FtsY [Parvibaculales bacterium]
MGLFKKLKSGLSRTSQNLSQGIGSIFKGRRLSAEVLTELEELLITSDLGLSASAEIIESLRREKTDADVTDTEIKTLLAAAVTDRLAPHEKALDTTGHKPFVILMTGVNGAGKTTTIGKLARKYLEAGQSVMLAAGDTFRAAAIEQLQIWGDRTGVPVVTTQPGGDAAGLAYDAMKRAKAEGVDVLIMDTAGRLQSNQGLMAELEKIIRVMQKIDASAPHASLLVLDATTGQNAVTQAEIFQQAAGTTGLIMTKLDGTARGGVLVAIGDKLGLPIHFIGVGEQAEDLQPFSAENFARALVGLDEAQN